VIPVLIQALRSLIPKSGILVVLVLACTTEPSIAPDAGQLAPRRPPKIVATASVSGVVRPCRWCASPVGGVASLTAAIQSIDDAIVLDAGDHFFAETTIAAPNRHAALRDAHALADAMREVGTVAMAVGPRDLAMGLDVLRELARRANVTLLSANLWGAGTSSLAFAGSTIVERNGFRIGLVGAIGSLTDRPRYSGQGSRKSRSERGSRTGDVGSVEVVPVPGSLAVAPASPAIEREVAWLGTQRVDRIVVLFAGPPPTKDWGADLILVPGDRDVAATNTLGAGALGRRLRSIEIGTSARWIEVEAAKWTDPPGIDPGSIRYAGSRECRSCHRAEHKHWRRHPHAKTFARLARLRQSSNRDCLPCHVTGFGRPGGPRRTVGLSRYAGVGCEACHGPGSEHIRTPEAPYGAVSRLVCVECHVPQRDQKPFDVAERWPRIIARGHGR